MSPAKMREALKRLPTRSEAYNKAYEDAMERVGSQIKGRKELATQVLSWITCAKRPMTVVELRHALAIEENSTVLDYDNRPELHDMISTCGGLVTVEEESNAIRLIHYTTQEYLERNQDTWFPDCQNSMGLACVVYLSFDTFRDGRCVNEARFKARLKHNPFYDYAARYWGYHISDASLQSQDAISKLFSHAKQLSGAVQALLVGHEAECRLYTPGRLRNVTGGHLAAYFGLLDTMTRLLRDGNNLESEDSYGDTPLHYALRSTIALALIEKGVKNMIAKLQPRHRSRAIAIASFEGYSEIVRMLLDRDVEDAAKGSALVGAYLEDANVHQYCYDSLYDHKSMMTFPFERDMDGNAGSRVIGFALIVASGRGHCEVLQMLLDNGADVNKRDPDMLTALHWAAHYGHDSVARLLIQHGSRLDLQDDFECTALHYAASAGHLSIVQVLVEAGSRLDTLDSHDWTPLFRAQQYDRVHVANWLRSLHRPLRPSEASGTNPIEIAGECSEDSEKDSLEISDSSKRRCKREGGEDLISATKRLKADP